MSRTFAFYASRRDNDNKRGKNNRPLTVSGVALQRVFTVSKCNLHILNISEHFAAAFCCWLSFSVIRYHTKPEMSATQLFSKWPSKKQWEQGWLINNSTANIKNYTAFHDGRCPLLQNKHKMFSRCDPYAADGYDWCNHMRSEMRYAHMPMPKCSNHTDRRKLIFPNLLVTFFAFPPEIDPQRARFLLTPFRWFYSDFLKQNVKNGSQEQPLVDRAECCKCLK